MDRLKLGIFGFGCVGQGLYHILTDRGLPYDIVGIGVKDKSKPRPISTDNFSYDPHEILDNPEIDIIVEVIDDSEQALEIVRKALLSGKNVVTANKKMVADHFEELQALQKNGSILRYEAAVCGSIPIINTLDTFHAAEPIEAITGIFNGSSNFILTQIEKKGLSYQDALKLAQELGFAESDPTLDVGGFDTLNKLVILLAHGFGVGTTPTGLFNLGIQNLNSEDFNFAKSRSLRIKLAARASVDQDQLTAYVLPAFIPRSNPLWPVEYENNAVTVKGVYSDIQMYTGKGAGSHPTAASVVADLASVTSRKGYGYSKMHQNGVPELLNKVNLPIYMRYQHPDQLREFSFSQLWSEGRYENGGFVLGEIGLNQLWSLQSFIEDQGITIIDTSAVKETIIDPAAVQKELVR